MLARDSRCHACDRKLAAGELVRLRKRDDEDEVLCRPCAGLDHLELLLTGDAAVTRLASKYSGVRFVVVKWDEMWKTYERKGVLVEPEALARARREAVKD